MLAPGVEFTRSAEAPSLGELRSQEISYAQSWRRLRQEFNSLAPPQPLIQRIERSRQFGAHRVAALACVGRAFCRGAIPTGRGLRWALAFEQLQIIPCKDAGNFRYNTVTVTFSVCQLRVAAYRWVAIPLLRAESRKVWEGGAKGRRARDATVRSGFCGGR